MTFQYDHEAIQRERVRKTALKLTPLMEILASIRRGTEFNENTVKNDKTE